MTIHSKAKILDFPANCNLTLRNNKLGRKIGFSHSFWGLFKNYVEIFLVKIFLVFWFQEFLHQVLYFFFQFMDDPFAENRFSWGF